MGRFSDKWVLIKKKKKKSYAMPCPIIFCLLNLQGHSHSGVSVPPDCHALPACPSPDSSLRIRLAQQSIGTARWTRMRKSIPLYVGAVSEQKLWLVNGVVPFICEARSSLFTCFSLTVTPGDTKPSQVSLSAHVPVGYIGRFLMWTTV